MTTEHGLEVRPEGGLTKAGLDRTGAQLKLLEEFVKERLVKNQDYGVIPGTNGKSTLLKPGAVNITGAFNCHLEGDEKPALEILDPVTGFVAYRFSVRIVSNLDGQTRAWGQGSCNSYEAKYRYRWEGRGGDRKRVENTNPLEQANTILKMALKRAEVDAAMRLPGVARFFTQDLEDMAPRTPAKQEEDVDAALAERDAQKPPAPAPAAQGAGEAHSAVPAPRLAPTTAGKEQEALNANDWNAFWAWCKGQKPPLDVPAVSAKLGAMPDAWLRAAPGARTLADVVKVLEAKP